MESKWRADNMREQKKESEHDDSVSEKNMKHLEPTTMSVDAVNSEEQNTRFNEDDQYASGSDYDPDTTSDLSYNTPPSRPARVFHSERFPREQAELLNRLSRSDDSLGSQYLMLQSQSGAAQESVTEAADRLHEGNMFSQGGKHSAAKPPLPSSRAIGDGLLHLEKHKESAGTIAQMKKVELLLPPEGLEPTFTTKTAGELAKGKGNFKEPQAAGTNVTDVPSTSIGKGAAMRKQENPAVLSEEIHWEERTARAAMEQTAAFAWLGTEAASQTEPSHPNPEKDILIDVNDCFPTDMLSDIFSKARIAEGSSCISRLRADDTDEFVHKDVSLMDQDHIGYSAIAPKVEDTVGVDLGPMDSQINFNEENQELPSTFEEGSDVLGPGYIASHPHSNDKGGEGFQVENPFPRMEADLHTTDSAYEELKCAIGDDSGAVIDASASDIDYSNLQIIMNEDLEELKELGSGTFGTVYHGKWRGSDVAIKRIKKSCFAGRTSEQERLALEFWREAEILSKLHHPNVVAFYGVVKDGPGGTLATVAEFMVNGSLRHVLLGKNKYLDLRKRLIIAMDAAFGMEYLHSKNIVHFDLKCDNLLVNLKDQSRPICKVADFGLSKVKRNTLVSGGVRGTLPWMAPELLNGNSNKVSEKVDVFSFGIVMWEILTGDEPYGNMHYGAIIGGIMNNTLRPTVPMSCDPEWKKLMEQCWAPDPRQRPSFTEIASRLRSMTSQTKPTR
ncbi:uncharacterized protein M6B38_305055 [Iris pallida]|uniref:Protein kinase domain-containing protein n=1 Tax=Iris pallida TaxID=29817 RepID=A0AAX6HM65_IRIPA|nr:uncharacterized protein M6B38_305055 [Iris pallida]